MQALLLPGKSINKLSRKITPREKKGPFAWKLFFFFSKAVIPTPQPEFTLCLENPRDGGAWWAAVYGDAQSRTLSDLAAAAAAAAEEK